VGAASSRDRFNSRLEAAPTGVFFSYLSLPDKRIFLIPQSEIRNRNIRNPKSKSPLHQDPIELQGGVGD